MLLFVLCIAYLYIIMSNNLNGNLYKKRIDRKLRSYHSIIDSKLGNDNGYFYIHSAEVLLGLHLELLIYNAPSVVKTISVSQKSPKSSTL
jgi:hypothetical protein